jgi:hypothetical protein
MCENLFALARWRKPQPEQRAPVTRPANLISKPSSSHCPQLPLSETLSRWHSTMKVQTHSVPIAPLLSLHLYGSSARCNVAPVSLLGYAFLLRWRGRPGGEHSMSTDTFINAWPVHPLVSSNNLDILASLRYGIGRTPRPSQLTTDEAAICHMCPEQVFSDLHDHNLRGTAHHNGHPNPATLLHTIYSRRRSPELEVTLSPAFQFS